MKIELLYGCLGYFGFGSGVVLAQLGPKASGSAVYCNSCQFSKECWQLHRERCQKFVPDLCAHIDELSKQEDGKKKIMEFIKENGSEPYIGIMMGNLDDGAHISCNLPPKDRGEMTIKLKKLGE